MSVAIYIGLMVLVNWMFVHVPMVSTPWGPWSWGSLVVGAVFVSRDYAQRSVGHWVLAAMAIGLALSYWAADPHIALASAAAFLASEGAEWVVYTITRRPFRERVLVSVAVAVPIDSAVFLLGIHGMSTAQFLVMSASKVVALLWIARPPPSTGETTPPGRASRGTP
jgi:queuosine precursor transporter